MSNFENLRKQAKLFLRWHREEYYPVATRIRTVLPRYRHLSDSQVLAATFKLSDAQELIAREQGFESWQALKAGVPVMSEAVKPVPSRVAVIAAEPQFFVADIKASCDFFTRLGFSVEFLYGEPPFYGQVSATAPESICGASIVRSLTCISEIARVCCRRRLRSEQATKSSSFSLSSKRPALTFSRP
jgi:hypothetical protein